MQVSGSNITGITKRLEKMGCLRRTHDPNDERRKWLEITDKGRGLLLGIKEEVKRSIEPMSCEPLSKVDRKSECLAPGA
ncbi:MAG: MarR family transcriptional regulator [Syntrophobacteraceae bacterium]